MSASSTGDRSASVCPAAWIAARFCCSRIVWVTSRTVTTVRGPEAMSAGVKAAEAWTAKKRLPVVLRIADRGRPASRAS